MLPCRPDFFIVGAPRCGTTALFTYLRQHPEIFMPEIKEPNFFCSDLNVRPHVVDAAEYASLFSSASGEKRVGEASVWYLYSERASNAIKSLNPEALIIIMLRQPVDMLHSLYSRRVHGGLETARTFQSAIEERATPRRNRLSKLFFSEPPAVEPISLEIGRYSTHVARYIDTFGRDQVKIIIYDDFRLDSESVYRDVLDFLDVRPDFAPSFKVVNSNAHVRNAVLHRIVRRPSPILRAIARLLVPRRLRPRVAETILDVNSRRAPRTALPVDLRRRLTAELAPDIVELGRLLGRDLSHWLVTEEVGPERACPRAS